MSLNKRLIRTNDAGIPPVLSPDPSSLSLKSSGSIPGGQYLFSSVHLDKINGGRFYYSHVGGEPANGKIGIATMTGYDLTTVSSSGLTSNFAVAYYMLSIAGNADGTILLSSGRVDGNTNQYISNWNIPSAWSLPTGFTQQGNRPNGLIPLSLDFSYDGTKMYIVARPAGTKGLIYEFALNSAFNVSSYTQTSVVDLQSISSDAFGTTPSYPNPFPNGFYIEEGKWSFDGSTFYALLVYMSGNSGQYYRLKAYNASTPYSISTLSERSTSTSLDTTEFTQLKDMGMSISADGHFLISQQPSNGAAIQLRMFGL